MDQAQQWPPATEGVSFGRSRPVGVQCAAARILRGSAHYIMVIHSEDGRRWAVAKRFSHFDNFKKLISPVLARLAPGTDQLPFPPKTPFGSGTGTQTVELRMEKFEQWLGAVIDIVTDDHIAESVVDGCTLMEEAALAEQKLCIFLAEDESVDADMSLTLGLEVRSSMLTRQAKRDRGRHMDPLELPEIVRRQGVPTHAGSAPSSGMNSSASMLGGLDGDSEEDDDTGPSPRGGVWKENEPLPLQSWDVQPPPHLVATRKLQGRTSSGRASSVSTAQTEKLAQDEHEHGSFVLKNPDRTSSNEMDAKDPFRIISADVDRQSDDMQAEEGDGVPVVVSFGVGQIGIQYRLAQAPWATGVSSASGRGTVLVIESIVPGGLAAMCTTPRLQAGFILTKISGESVKGQRYEHMMRRMRSAPRPLTLTFEAPLNPAARTTAAIKDHTAAAAAAAVAAAAADAWIAQVKEQQGQGRAMEEMPLGAGSGSDHSVDDEDVSSEVGSGDGNLSSTPDTSDSGDVNLRLCTLADTVDDGQGQAYLSDVSPADTPDRRATRGLKGLNGGVTPDKTRAPGSAGSARAAAVDESVELGPVSEGQDAGEGISDGQQHCSQERYCEEQPEQICLSFVREGPIGLELTISTKHPQEGQVIVRSVRSGTQAIMHVPPLRPGLVLTRIGDVDIRGRCLDDVYSIIMKHEHRPLMVTFIKLATVAEHPRLPEQQQEESGTAAAERLLEPEKQVDMEDDKDDIDESVEKSTESDFEAHLVLRHDTAALTLADAEKLLAESETERKANHGAL